MFLSVYIHFRKSTLIGSQGSRRQRSEKFLPYGLENCC